MKCYKCKAEMVRDKKSDKNSQFSKVWVCPKCKHEIIEESDK